MFWAEMLGRIQGGAVLMVDSILWSGRFSWFMKKVHLALKGVCFSMNFCRKMALMVG